MAPPRLTWSPKAFVQCWVVGKKCFGRISLPFADRAALVQLMVTPLREDRLVGAAVMHLNITERRQMEQAAQLNQKRLRDLIDGLGPSMFVGLMTPQGILIEANRPALEAAGLKPEDVLGKPFEETCWWTYSREVQQQLREAIARAVRGEVSRYDVQVRVADGKI